MAPPESTWCDQPESWRRNEKKREETRRNERGRGKEHEKNVRKHEKT
jgi:hypothetical protein